MNQYTPTPSASKDVIDIWELWQTIWTGRVLIIVLAGVFTLIGSTYALLAQEWFKAEVVLVPAEKKSFSGALGQLGGLASLAGIDIPGAKEQEPVAVLKSSGFSRAFIEDMKLEDLIMEGEAFQGDEPDIRDAVRVFNRKVRSVTEDQKTGLVTLSIRWKDPETAAIWANLLVQRLNDRLRNQALAESERNVTYLQREIAASSVVSLQQSMGRVLESEMQKLMLARGNEEFAFKIIDRAVPPKQRDTPKRALVVIVSLLAGGFLGILAVFFRKAIHSRSER